MISKNNVVHIGQGKDTLGEIPSPPVWLSDSAKKHYKKMAAELVKLERLKSVFLPALEIYSEAMAQYEFSARAIKDKNRDFMGEGYIQVFKSGASNLSTEVVLMRDAEKTLFKCFKQFGLDPKSEKELNISDQGQFSLFEDLQRKMSGK